MSDLNKIIEKGIDRAFNSMRSLATTVTIKSVGKTSFNFKESTVDNDGGSLTAKAIIVQSKPSTSTNRREFTTIINVSTDISVGMEMSDGVRKFRVVGSPQRTSKCTLCTLSEVV